MKRKFLMLLLMLFSLAIPGSVSAAGSIGLYVNGQQITPDVPPRIVQGRVILPARAILEPLGAELFWDSKSRTVTVFQGVNKITLIINQKTATVNGIKYTLDAPATIINGRTFLPVRFIAEAFDSYVEWDSTNRLVKVLHNDSSGRGTSVVIGYYYDYRSLTDLENYGDKITDTIHFSYELNSENRVQEKVFFEQGLRHARQNGMGAEMLVAAFDKPLLKNLMEDESSQKLVIEDINGILESRGFDGVNMDLEGIDPSQRDNYVNFISMLKEGLGSRYTLSLSLPARTSDREWWYDGYDYQSLAKIADRIMIMAYDQHHNGGEPGPVAGNDWVERVINYLLPQIPKEKFQLGLGIYGRDWPETGVGKAIFIQDARNLAAAKGVAIQKDQASGVSWFSYTDDSGIKHQVWFEDRESAQSKLELAKKYQLSGVALWRLGVIPPDIWEIFNKG
ncbi:stalk domain-containing protein [Dehalobacterium formicoaceticum]|uniref:stalk domain-containing protein n=1 Tax=Dehalobacterium formicoaceticum TaxID=51515 RepID=UPI0031F63932